MISVEEINELLKAHKIAGYANEWNGRRIYINLDSKSSSFAGDRNYQLYLDLSTGELVSRNVKGCLSTKFRAETDLIEEIFANLNKVEEVAAEEIEVVEAAEVIETEEVVATVTTAEKKEEEMIESTIQTQFMIWDTVIYVNDDDSKIEVLMPESEDTGAGCYGLTHRKYVITDDATIGMVRLCVSNNADHLVAKDDSTGFTMHEIVAGLPAEYKWDAKDFKQAA